MERKKDKNGYVKNFAGRVKARREALGLDQIDIAFHCGTSTSYISRLENGKIEPGIYILCLLTQVLKCTSADLLDC